MTNYQSPLCLITISDSVTRTYDSSLFPQQNAFRAVDDLAGYWRFKVDVEDEGVARAWFDEPLSGDVMQISVPGSWNEQLAERGLMNYVGPAWYECETEASHIVEEALTPWLRVAAVEHRADVWLNGIHLTSHEGGYIPFGADLSVAWRKGGRNRLTIRVDNRLSLTTLPQGIDPDAHPYNAPSFNRQHTNPPARFDFHVFGGITRSVNLLWLPECHVASIDIDATLDGTVVARVGLEAADGEAATVRLQVLRGDGEAASTVATGKSNAVNDTVRLQIDDVRPWSPADPYLYLLRVEVVSENGDVVDRYDERFGVREVSISNGSLLLNGEPLFLTGCGKHEDFPIIGRGQFRGGYLRDFELLRWLGANSFRTSHYPYDEEIMRLADELGFLVIDEVPAVSLGFPSDRFEDFLPLLETHKTALSRLIVRDGNHPSVIAWSVVNEPHLWSEPDYLNEATDRYFGEIYRYTKSLDATRPVMAVSFARHSTDDIALRHCDIIGLNRYFGWYDSPVELGTARDRFAEELDAMYEAFGVPVVLTEFGADTIDGYHATTPQLFSEEYQEELLRIYCEVAESRAFCAGEHVWNFADFRTTQHFRRVILNRKGLFTRERHPKRAAFAMRERWLELERVVEAHRPKVHSSEYLIADAAQRPGILEDSEAASHG